MISTNALTSFSTRQKTGLNFCLLLQRALRAISTACPCPDGFPLPPPYPSLTPPACSSYPAPLPRSQQTDPPTPSPQGNKHRIIYSSPFPLVPSVFISLSLCSMLPLLFSLSFFFPPIILLLLQVQSPSGES